MDILFNAPAPIPLHALAAMGAILIGAIQLLSPKGGTPHKLLGWLWVGLIGIVAATSFFIHEIEIWGLFSPIHLLSALTLITLAIAIISVRKGNIRRHQKIMKLMYGLALILTGLFTLLPGRIMHQIIFG